MCGRSIGRTAPRRRPRRGRGRARGRPAAAAARITLGRNLAESAVRFESNRKFEIYQYLKSKFSSKFFKWSTLEFKWSSLRARFINADSARLTLAHAWKLGIQRKMGVQAACLRRPHDQSPLGAVAEDGARGK